MPATTPPQANAERIRWIFDRLNDHDAAAMSEVWTAETVVRFPDRTCRGRDEVAAYVKELFAAVPDLRMDVQSVVEQGDEVFVRWTATGTHEGTIQGVDGTGRRLEIDGMDHVTLREGKIVSNFVLFDQMQWARAVGMLPPQDSAADKAVKAALNLKTQALRRLRSRG